MKYIEYVLSAVIFITGLLELRNPIDTNTPTNIINTRTLIMFIAISLLYFIYSLNSHKQGKKKNSIIFLIGAIFASLVSFYIIFSNYIIGT